MLKNILAVIAGYAVWTVLFLGGSLGIRAVFASAHDAAGMTRDPVPLAAYLALSVLASFVAGFVTARLADSNAGRWVGLLAVGLLATGIPVQANVWDALPVWYNLAFLLLLAPVTLWGGKKGAP